MSFQKNKVILFQCNVLIDLRKNMAQIINLYINIIIKVLFVVIHDN